MAIKIPPTDAVHCNGAVNDRKLNTTTDRWIKRDVHTGRFMDVKMDGTPFKGIRREKAMDVINKLKDR